MVQGPERFPHREAEGTGLAQPGEEKALEGPASSPTVPMRRSSRRQTGVSVMLGGSKSWNTRGFGWI